MLAAGRLRERISIRRLTDVRDDVGSADRDWTDMPGMGSIHAEVIGISGREAVIGEALHGIATFRITIRYREGIRANDQILWRGQELNIKAPPQDPTGRREMLQIIADTSSPQGA